MLPSVPSLNTYGGALYDYSPVIDATRERPAAGANNGYNDTAMAAAIAPRAWAQITPAGSGTPVLTTHFAMWGGGVGVAPVVARTSTGIYTVTWPTTVNDYIPFGVPGYNGAIALNFRAGWANSEGTTTLYLPQVKITSANVATVYIWNGSNALADPSSVAIDVYVI